jgi:hypothetical protein
MVDVSDDAEVPNLRRRREGLVGETADGDLLVERFASMPSVSVQKSRDTIPVSKPLSLRVYAANMASGRKSQWKTFQRFAENLVNEAPKVVQRLQNTQETLRTIQQAVKITANIVAMGLPAAPAEITAGRPVTETSFPTAQRARKVIYAPDLDGQADPGEIVWTWVVYEDDPTRGKDRPVLVVGRERSVLLGLMLSSQERHEHDRDWVKIGTGDWDYEGRQSWVRLDRVLDVPEEGIRREGAILDRKIFDVVAARLRTEYSWR